MQRNLERRAHFYSRTGVSRRIPPYFIKSCFREVVSEIILRLASTGKKWSLQRHPGHSAAVLTVNMFRFCLSELSSSASAKNVKLALCVSLTDIPAKPECYLSKHNQSSVCYWRCTSQSEWSWFVYWTAALIRRHRSRESSELSFLKCNSWYEAVLLDCAGVSN